MVLLLALIVMLQEDNWYSAGGLFLANPTFTSCQFDVMLRLADDYLMVHIGIEELEFEVRLINQCGTRVLYKGQLDRVPSGS